MSNWSFQFVLFAQRSRFDSMRGKFSSRRTRLDSDDILTAIVVIALIALGVYLLAKVNARREKGRSFKSPRGLFRELCKVHDMCRAEKRLLKQIARWQRLSQPARLFLEPDRFDIANLSPQLQGQMADVLAIRDSLFAQPIPDRQEEEDEPNAKSHADSTEKKNLAKA